MEMPTARYMNNATIAKMLASGAVNMSKVDDSAWRILWPLFAVGAFDKNNTGKASDDVTSPAHTLVARNLAAAGTVLLQNDGGLLPISLKAVKNIAVIGSQAMRPIYAGGGSGAVATSHVSAPLTSIQTRAGIAPAPPAATTAGAAASTSMVPPPSGKIAAATTTTTTTTFTFASAAQVTSKGCQVEGVNPAYLRSGAPPQQTSASLVLKLAPGSTITGVSFAYEYVTGYSGTVGANFTLEVAGTAAYSSPVLNKYPYGKPSVYSPPVNAAVTGLNVAVPPSGGDVAFTFDNVDKNLQLALPMQINITCSGASACFTAPPPPPPPPSPPPTCSKDGSVCVHYNDGSDLATAAAAAAAADVALVFVGTSSEEGGDRGSLALGSQDALVAAVAAVAGKKTAVVAVTPGALLTPWRRNVSAVLTPFMPGQAYGDAIAAVLFGDVNPSAKLPVTFPNVENETQFSLQQWPGVHGNNTGSPCAGWHDTDRCNSVYTEKLEVGYRWYAAHPDVQPAFPFGHGISYTTFAYSKLAVSATAVSFTLTNTGKVAGAEVAQLYLNFPASSSTVLI